MASGAKEAAGGSGPVVWMFPGQGAQYFRMGQALYGGGGPFRRWMDRLDAIAADYVGESIVGIVYDETRSKSEPFDQLLYTHPALFMVQYALAQTLLEEGFPAPDMLMGASLGEFVAAAVAGAAGVETMVFDLIKQARLFEAQSAGGAMLAVIREPASFAADPVFAGRCELAGTFFDQCFVVSGWKSDLLEVAAGLARQDVGHQLLPVPAGFHSSLMDPVEDLYVRMFSGREWGEPAIPVVSCAGGGTRRTARDWWRVVRAPIEFMPTLRGFAEAHPDAVYVDIGPAGNMASFAKYNLPKTRHDRIIPTMTPFGRDGESLDLARQRLAALL